MDLQEHLDGFRDYLTVNDRTERTTKIYMLFVRQFFEYIEKNPIEVTQEDLNRYKVYLREKYEQNSTIPKLSSINSFMKYLGKDVFVKIPKSIEKNKDVLTPEESDILSGINA